MGVIYKLKDEVVHFIISQRQGNPLFSCRQLAESASQKFGVHLSKSSVHDVLKESGIVTPRGRKPKDKFEIPQEKKKQIQVSLSQVDVKYLSPPNVVDPAKGGASAEDPEIAQTLDSGQKHSGMTREDSFAHEGAGKIFLKAAAWDLGIFSEESIKEEDWNYYLTYSKGVKVNLENKKNFFIDLPLPLERCIREVADGLISNVKPFIAYKVSDDGLFKSCMEGVEGFKIDNISIVDHNDQILFEYDDIMEFNRDILFDNRIFVESNDQDLLKRTKSIFFSQIIDNNEDIDNILNLKGFETLNKDENIVSIMINDSYENKVALQAAAETLNGMYLRDEMGRLLKVKIRTPLTPSFL